MENQYNVDEISQIAAQFSPELLKHFRPTPDQESAFTSMAYELIVAGGNKSGKTYSGITKVGFRTVPEMDIYNERTGWLLDPYVRKRVPTGRRINAGISSWSEKTQIETIKPAFDKILSGHFKMRSSGNAYLSAVGEVSDITFKAQTQGVQAYTGANLDFGLLDEPHLRVIYREMQNRFLQTKGVMWNTLTPVIDSTDPDFEMKRRFIEWMRVEIIEPYEENPNLFPLLEIIYLDTENNEHVDYDFIDKKWAGLPNEEKAVRKTGRFIVFVGNVFYSDQALKECESYLKNHPEESTPDVGYLEYDDVAQDEYEVIFSEPDRSLDPSCYPRDGWCWQIWEHPLKDTFARPQYFLGGDTAEETTTGDYTCLYIIRGDNNRIVACLHGYMDEVTLAQQIWLGGYYYRDLATHSPAYAAAEVNTTGKTAMEFLANGSKEHGILAYEGKQLYHRIREDISMVGRSRTINIGWKTTSGTRNLLLADLRFMLSDNLRSIRNGGQALIPDRNWYIEARNFMLNPKGKFEHAKGHHDDRLFAGAIAMQAKKQGYRTIRNLTEIDRKNIEDNSLFLYKDGQIVMNHRALREKVVIKTKKTLYF